MAFTVCDWAPSPRGTLIIILHALQRFQEADWEVFPLIACKRERRGTPMPTSVAAFVSRSPLGTGYDEARAIFESIATRPDYVEFLTLPAYEQLVAVEVEA